MKTEADIAYIAGLFDGEGCITYKQYMRKRPHNKKAYPTWSIRMEMAMTDESVLRWVHEVLGVGTVGEKRYKTKYTVGWKGNTKGSVEAPCDRMRRNLEDKFLDEKPPRQSIEIL